ncbi:sensor histidine kinase [Roseiconus lacunae]|uniref:sensor histidine kinase n=1 Tax=Roseiconus lacunae TaxID=2605694 RepID=UPI001E406946|nr:sensor histidine kinase [Roseiconus lacunae]MCD0460327.1 sensor histidine kinase [Roseiconus lacunae]
MKIVWQIRWFSILLVLTTAVLIGAIVAYGYRRITRFQQVASLRQIRTTGELAIQNELRALVDSISLTAMFPTVKSALQNANGMQVDDVEEEDAALLIQQIFKTSIQYRDYFDQVRLIGTANGGKEVVRVDRKNGEIVVVRGDDLQPKGSRYYFDETMRLGAGEVFLSDIDLNREFGEIEIPHRPMLRIAAPVKDDEGTSIGIVVYNIRFNALVENVLHNDSDAYQYLITNDEGDYLLHPDSDRVFGFELGKRYRLQEDYPSASGLFPTLGGGERKETAPEEIALDKGHHQLVVDKFSLLPGVHPRQIVLGVLATNLIVSDSQTRVIQWATIATGLLVMVSLIVAYLSTNFLTRPLQQITLAARNIRARKSVEMLPVQRDDEIGTLARAFEAMVAEVKQSESDLRSTNHRLLEAIKDLEHFTHLAAHDLREPIRKQLNLLELLREQLPEADEELLIFYVSRIQRCADQMYRMVDDFRRLTRLSGGELTREPINFDQIIDTALHSFEEQLSCRGVEIKRDVFPSGLFGYPSLLEWLYNNLIANALRYVDRDGFEIAFTAEQAEETGWIFGVRNTGSTIPSSQLEEIFKMFRKADTGQEEASGIGLSLCRRIVDKHSGEIFAESGPDFTHLKFTLRKQHDREQNNEQ